MKQTFLKFPFRKTAAAVLLSSSLLLTGFAGNAATKPVIEIISGGKSNVSLVSTTSDALIFKMNINNETGSTFKVTIKNEAGEILFSKSFTDVTFEKNFKVLKNDNDNGRYYFTINSANATLEDTFVVTTSVRTVDDIAINKL